MPFHCPGSFLMQQLTVLYLVCSLLPPKRSITFSCLTMLAARAIGMPSPNSSARYENMPLIDHVRPEIALGGFTATDRAEHYCA